MLVGLVTKNAILLVDYTNILRRRDGMEIREAVEVAGRTRLRPILMTTAATVVGHFPLVLATGPGAGARNSIGIVLVSGMVIGTLFTLFVVPVFYSLIATEHETVAAREREALDSESRDARALEVAHA